MLNHYSLFSGAILLITFGLHLRAPYFTKPIISGGYHRNRFSARCRLAQSHLNSNFASSFFFLASSELFKAIVRTFDKRRWPALLRSSSAWLNSALAYRSASSTHFRQVVSRNLPESTHGTRLSIQQIPSMSTAKFPD
uniref:(northern house mosquito) hypothetical protein n=1 Tax=Culex pipiens TaxID=7175 RepID=A0A8D8F706_CULPI